MKRKNLQKPARVLEVLVVGGNGLETPSKTSGKPHSSPARSNFVANRNAGVRSDIAQSDWERLIQIGRSFGLSDQKLVLLVDVVERLPAQLPAESRAAIISILADPWLAAIVNRWTNHLTPEQKAQIIEAAEVFNDLSLARCAVPLSAHSGVQNEHPQGGEK